VNNKEKNSQYFCPNYVQEFGLWVCTSVPPSYFSRVYTSPPHSQLVFSPPLMKLLVCDFLIFKDVVLCLPREQETHPWPNLVCKVIYMC
jgi:hypothetical protein